MSKTRYIITYNFDVVSEDEVIHILRLNPDALPTGFKHLVSIGITIIVLSAEEAAEIANLDEVRAVEEDTSVEV